MEKLSIIVPIYKVEKYLYKCIDSIIHQTYSNLEIILVDDGSPDHCGEICDQYAKKDSRIQVIHKENGGLSDARNAGIKVATGEFITFVDSDDSIALDMYETLMNLCTKYYADIAACNMAYVFEKNQKIISDDTYELKELTPTQAYSIMIDYYGKLRMGVWNKIYHRSLFQGIFFPKGQLYEDLAIMYKIIFRANKVMYLSEAKYYYLQRNDAITSQGYSEREYDRYQFMNEMVNFIHKNAPEIYSNAISYKHINGYLSIVNRMIWGNVYDKNFIKKIQADIREEKNILLKGSLPQKRKFQILLLAYSFNLYKWIYKILKPILG